MTITSSTFPDGVVIPHGTYDVKLNEGYIILETSKDTSEFCCDCIKNGGKITARKIASRQIAF